MNRKPISQGFITLSILVATTLGTLLMSLEPVL